MSTYRASLNRLLDGNDTSLTLMTLAKAATVLGLKVNIELVALDEQLSPSTLEASLGYVIHKCSSKNNRLIRRSS